MQRRRVINFGVLMKCWKCKHWDKDQKRCSIFGYLLKQKCYLYRRLKEGK